jgi:hypothetical protein
MGTPNLGPIAAGNEVPRFDQIDDVDAVNITAQTGFAADTYLAGSALTVPSSIKTGSIYKCRFAVSKTAAGIATSIINVRVGTGVVGDTSRANFTFGAQTAALDSGEYEVIVWWRSIGATTVLVVLCRMSHNNSTTGLNSRAAQAITFISGSFALTAGTDKIGISVNGGASAAWTIDVVEARFENDI